MNEGKKWDKGKLRLDLVPPEVQEYLAPVYEHGLKYGFENWKKGFEKGRLEAAALRHILSYRKGEKIDKESGLPHLSHAMWNIFTMIWYDENEKIEYNKIRSD